jgi:hypothetical protein
MVRALAYVAAGLVVLYMVLSVYIHTVAPGRVQ